MVYAKNPQPLSPWKSRGAGLGDTKKDKMCQFKTRGREKEGSGVHNIPASKASLIAGVTSLCIPPFSTILLSQVSLQPSYFL